MIYKILKRADIWKHAKKYSTRAKVRKAAIAYVTQDHVGFRRDDVLVVDASDSAIKSNQTSAELLGELFRKGVLLYNWPGLHAKTLLLDNYCIVGSANMSGGALEELAVFTNNQTLISGVAAFIAGFERPKNEIDESEIKRLLKIPVIKRKFGTIRGKRTPTIGGRTWIVGTRFLAREPLPADQRIIDRGKQDLDKRHRKRNFDWDHIQWSGKSSFLQKSSAGDTVIQIWGEKGSSRAWVTRGVPLLHKRFGKRLAWTFIGDRPKTSDTVSWGKFQKILKTAGARPAKRHGVRRLDQDVAEAIDKVWTKVR